jgi:hypothetical protein
MPQVSVLIRVRSQNFQYRPDAILRTNASERQSGEETNSDFRIREKCDQAGHGPADSTVAENSARRSSDFRVFVRCQL